MAISPSFILFFIITSVIILSHTRISAAELICKTTSCESSVSIQFPFRLKEANQSYMCGYPGFELTCSKKKLSEPLLTLPESGDFVVKRISLEDQMVWVNDPDKCLPQRFMDNHGLNLRGSPFRLSDYYTLVDFSFLKCPSNSTLSSIVRPISCLKLNNGDDNNVNYSVVAMMSNPPFATPWSSSCEFISTASIPVEEDTTWLFWADYHSDIPLRWENPDCGTCEERGGRCGFLADSLFQVSCFDLPTQGKFLILPCEESWLLLNLYA